MYEINEQDGRVEVVVEDVDEQALYTELCVALADVLSGASGGIGGTPVTHEVRLSGSSAAELLTHWAQELIRLAEEGGFLGERVEKERLEGTSFSARVAGVTGIPREQIRDLLVHDVELTRLDDAAWSVRATFDAPRR